VYFCRGGFVEIDESIANNDLTPLRKTERQTISMWGEHPDDPALKSSAGFGRGGETVAGWIVASHGACQGA
jgi:hypothetical protein